jgi:hypothetical protein
MLVVRRIRFAAEDPSPMWKVFLPLIRPLLKTPNKGAATSVYLAGFVELDPLARTRVTDDGAKRFVGCYRDSDGRQRSAGTYTSRRAAERTAHREEVQVRDGA